MSRRTLAPLAAALGLILAASAAGGAARTTPLAEAAGGDAVPIDPSIVAVRIARAEAALLQAGVAEDANDPAAMLAAVKAARFNTTRALNAARWLVETMPPTPADDGLADGGAPAGVAYAGPEDTLVSVLMLQHEVVTTAVGLMTARGAKTASLRKAWVSAAAGSIAQRNKAIAFVHSRKANAATFATLMPGVMPTFMDELKQINGRLKMNKFGPKLRASLKNATTRVKKQRTLVKKYWPPVPAG